ncbi:unnamed protein product, partial [Ectocarpus sp. 4 AP-2014]
VGGLFTDKDVPNEPTNTPPLTCPCLSPVEQAAILLLPRLLLKSTTIAVHHASLLLLLHSLTPLTLPAIPHHRSSARSIFKTYTPLISCPCSCGGNEDPTLSKEYCC